MNTFDEKTLVRKAKNSPEAFGILYEKYYSKIYRYILHRTANVQVSLDITSNVFIKALEHIESYEWRNFPFSSWLYKIAGNEVNDYFSQKKKGPASLDRLMDQKGFEPQDWLDLEEQTQRAEKELREYKDFLHIQKIMCTFDVEDQEILTLRFFEGKKIREIAEIIGKKEGTVKSQVSRLITKIRNEIELSSKEQMQPFETSGVVVLEKRKNI